MCVYNMYVWTDEWIKYVNEYISWCFCVWKHTSVHNWLQGIIPAASLLLTRMVDDILKSLFDPIPTYHYLIF